MLRILFFLFFIATAASNLFGQGWNYVGARSNGLSNASVCLNDVWAYHHNPGALASVQQTTAGAFYEARFQTKELQTQAVVIATPLKKGVFSFGGQLFGNENYRNSRLGVGYSMQLSERFAAGVQGNMEYLKLGGNYGSAWNATAEAGLIALISDKWKMGMSVLNIGRQSIGATDDRYATTMRLGANFTPSSKLMVAMEIEKQVIHPVSFKMGIEYLPTDQFYLRIGAQSGPTSFAFGCGYKKKNISVDLGSRFHPILGWSPMIGFNYQFTK
jgi:hypothetical protein